MNIPLVATMPMTTLAPMLGGQISGASQQPIYPLQSTNTISQAPAPAPAPAPATATATATTAENGKRSITIT